LFVFAERKRDDDLQLKSLMLICCRKRRPSYFRPKTKFGGSLVSSLFGDKQWSECVYWFMASYCDTSCVSSAPVVGLICVRAQKWYNASNVDRPIPGTWYCSRVDASATQVTYSSSMSHYKITALSDSPRRSHCWLHTHTHTHTVKPLIAVLH